MGNGWGTDFAGHDFFPLNHGHAIADCARCHTTSNFSDPSPVSSSCHMTDYNATTDPNHGMAGFSTDCASCHTTGPGWDGSFDHNLTSFPLHGSHNQKLMALPVEQGTVGFFNCCTGKGVYIKARGLGLSVSLDSFDVSLAPNEPAILRATRPDANEAARWSLHSLDVESNYAAALAVGGNDLEISCWDWNINR